MKVKWVLGVISFGRFLSPTCHYLGHGSLPWQVPSPHPVGVFHFLSLSGRCTSSALRRQGGCAETKRGSRALREREQWSETADNLLAP